MILALAASGLLLGGGFWLAANLEDAQEVVFTERVLTVTRTTIVKGKPQVVTEIRTITTEGAPRVRTVRRDGRTVYITQPGETVVSTRTVKGPLRKSVVFKDRVRVIPGRERVVTLPGRTLPGTTITGPERIVTTTGPAQTVTTPGETVEREVVRTVAGPTTTVTGPTQTVTGPTTTVTGPTQTVTHTVTETETETVEVTVTETTGGP